MILQVLLLLMNRLIDQDPCHRYELKLSWWYFQYDILFAEEDVGEDKAAEVYTSGDSEEEDMVRRADFGTKWKELPAALKVQDRYLYILIFITGIVSF